MLRRAVFSDVQRKALEKMFQKQKYISKPDRKKLASKLGLKDSQVKCSQILSNAQHLVRNLRAKTAGAHSTAPDAEPFSLTTFFWSAGENLVPEPADEVEELKGTRAAVVRWLPRADAAHQSEPASGPQRRGQEVLSRRRGG